MEVALHDWVQDWGREKSWMTCVTGDKRSRSGLISMPGLGFRVAEFEER